MSFLFHQMITLMFVGVFYDFAKNEMAYEPILEFGLKHHFPQKVLLQ